MNTILQFHYAEVTPESSAAADDIVVWHGPDCNTPHSAVVTEPISDANRLGYSSKLRTKNGQLAETNTILEDLVKRYGETYRVYRQK